MNGGSSKRKTSLQKLKGFLKGVAEMSMSDTVEMVRAIVAMGVSGLPEPLKEIYTLSQQTLLGLRRIHVQLRRTHFYAEFKGLDIGLFLPPLPEGGAHEEGGVDEE